MGFREVIGPAVAKRPRKKNEGAQQEKGTGKWTGMEQTTMGEAIERNAGRERRRRKPGPI